MQGFVLGGSDWFVLRPFCGEKHLGSHESQQELDTVRTELALNICSIAEDRKLEHIAGKHDTLNRRMFNSIRNGKNPLLRSWSWAKTTHRLIWVWGVAPGKLCVVQEWQLLPKLARLQNNRFKYPL